MINDDEKFHHKRGVFKVLSVMMRDKLPLCTECIW